jgi:TetR/AcrR family transcriptional regulator, ethionamide resistance regulator
MPARARNTATAGTAAARSASDQSQVEARAAILNATEDLLADTALQDLSVAQIIAEAGISRATFYFYFGSKFAVVAALVQQSIEEIYTATRPTLRSDPGPARIAALTQRISNSADVWDRHRPVLGATVENWQAYPELRDLWLEMIGGLTDAISAEIVHERALGNCPPGPDARALAALLAWTTERCLYLLGKDYMVASEDRQSRLGGLTQTWLHVMYGAGASEQAAA